MTETSLREMIMTVNLLKLFDSHSTYEYRKERKSVSDIDTDSDTVTVWDRVGQSHSLSHSESLVKCQSQSVTQCGAGPNDGLSQKRWTIGEQSWLYRLFYPLCVSRRINTWQIVYLYRI